MVTRTYRDAWGIPHLCAGSPGELAFAQGRNVAIDRAFQIEVDRHRGQGSSASFLGADAVAWDRFARQSRLEDTARRCFARLDEQTRAFVTAFVDGVNAGLPEGRRRAPEFAETGLSVGHWQPHTPLSIWLATHILFAGFPNKLWREEVARRLGDDALELFASDGPRSAGSNGWLLSGERTVHGAALLAGDPHRFIEDPGVYQQVHLACPEFDVVGLAIPGVPGLAHFGHTGKVAWAITNAMADYQDLFYEQLRRRDGQIEALGPEGFRPASFHEEIIEVKGGEAIRVPIIETGRGPVVVGGLDDTVAISLRYLPRVEGELGFAALPMLLRAQTVGDVDRALAHWVEPVNVVQAADTAGGLLHCVAGRVPKRARANSLRVVPAWEPAHAWQGLHEPMPHAPMRDLAVMANQRGLSAELGVEFAPPHRAQRITQLLRARPRWSASDMASVHTDTWLASARPLLLLIRRLDNLTVAGAALRERLAHWDGHMRAESCDATAYARVRWALVERVATEPRFRELAQLLSESHPYPDVFLPWLALVPRVAFALEGLLHPELLPDLDRAALMRAALEDVAAAGEPDQPWGELHRLAPWQAWSEREEAWPGLSGDHDCVLSAGSIPGLTHHCLRGPAARFVWDLARRDDSLWVVPLGASGVPGHPHHRDQLPLWLRGELLPVITDWTQLSEESDMSVEAKQPPRAVYERVVPGFGLVQVAPVDPVADLDVIDAWVKQERAQYWGMGAHSREYVQEIYEYLDSLETHHAYLLRRDGEPVALMQTYQPSADPVGECYSVQPGDFGIHVLVGPVVSKSERGFTARLLDVFLEFVLLDPSVKRIVAEPDVRNTRALARFVSAGFVPDVQIDLPEKRAQLVFLKRSAFRARSLQPVVQALMN